jgi:hypothetical protein
VRIFHFDISKMEEEHEPLNQIEPPPGEVEIEEAPKEKDPKHPETIEDYNKSMAEYKTKLQKFSVAVIVFYLISLAIMVIATSVHDWVS